MTKNEIKVGGKYLMKVSGNVVPVRVDEIRTHSGGMYRNDRTTYYCTNLRTRRDCEAHSAAKFRGEYKGEL